jgi:hypothetical protein
MSGWLLDHHSRRRGGFVERGHLLFDISQGGLGNLLATCHRMAPANYTEIANLARLCAINARLVGTREIAAVLWKMACEHQRKAAELDGGRLPDIGAPPAGIVE